MSPAASSEAEWARAVKIIDGAKSVWLACHVRPDADALGSMLAFASALTSKRQAAGRPSDGGGRVVR